MKTALACAILAVLLSSAAAVRAQGTELVVYQVQAAQLPGTGLVDVWYRLSTVDDGPVTVSLFLSTDGGATYPFLCQSVTGDVGPGVLPGTSRHIVWDAGADFPGFSSASCRLRVTADDGVVLYQPADLAGVWESHGVAFEGPGAPWWMWGVDTVTADGSFSGTVTQSDGWTGDESGSLALTADGLLTIPGTEDDFLGALDADKDVFLFTDAWGGGGDAGTVEMGLGVRRGTSYGMSDLVGRWEDNRMASLPGAPWWMRGELLIAPDGSFTGQVSEFGRAPTTMTGTFPPISPDGVIEWVGGDPGSRGVMNAGKTVIVGTATWDGGAPGTAELSVDVKMAASYSLADLQGTWQVHSVSSGRGPWYWRATVVIGPNGAFVATATENGGSPTTETGLFTIAANGIVSFPGHPAYRGVLDAGKTVLVATNTWPDGASEMSIALKMRR